MPTPAVSPVAPRVREGDNRREDADDRITGQRDSESVHNCAGRIGTYLLKKCGPRRGAGNQRADPNRGASLLGRVEQA